MKIEKIADTIDAEDDVITVVVQKPDAQLDGDEIEEVAYRFMEDEAGKRQYKFLNGGVVVVENGIARVGFLCNGKWIPKNAWYMKCRVTDSKMLRDIKSGEASLSFLGNADAQPELIEKGDTMDDLTEMFQVFDIDFAKNRIRISDDEAVRLQGILREFVRYKNDLPSGLLKSIEGLLAMFTEKLGMESSILEKSKMFSWDSVINALEDTENEYGDDDDDDEFYDFVKRSDGNFPSVTRILFGRDS